MYGYVTGHAYRSPSMGFRPADLLDPNSKGHADVVARIEAFSAFQAQWTRRLAIATSMSLR